MEIRWTVTDNQRQWRPVAQDSDDSHSCFARLWRLQFRFLLFTVTGTLPLSLAVPRVCTMIRKAMRFWSEETGQTALLIFLSFEMFLLFPLLQQGILLGLVNSFIFSLLLLAGLLTITRHPVLRGACHPFSCRDHNCGLVARGGDTGLGAVGRSAFCSWPGRADGRRAVGGPQGRPCNGAPYPRRHRSLPVSSRFSSPMSMASSSTCIRVLYVFRRVGRR